MGGKNTFCSQLLDEGLAEQTYGDKLLVHQVLKELTDDLFAVANSLDNLEAVDFLHALEAVERQNAYVNGAWVKAPLVNCFRDLQQLFRELDKDSYAPALADQFHTANIYKNVIRDSSYRIQPRTYGEHAHQLGIMTERHVLQAMQFEGNVRAYVDNSSASEMR